MQDHITPPSFLSTQEHAGVQLPATTIKGVANAAAKFDAFQFLRSLDEFSEVPSSELKTLAEVSRVATIASGQYIATEGDDEGLYGFIVVSGRIAMQKTSSNGKVLLVELLQSGDIFGLLLTLAAERLPAQLSARAIQNSKVLWVPIDAFTRLIRVHPPLFKEAVSHLLICLQASYCLSRGLAHDRVEVRIAAVLSSLSLKFAIPVPPSEPFTISFTRQQLADLTGTTPETAIRVTRAMQASGYIDITRPGVVRILNRNALQELVDE